MASRGLPSDDKMVIASDRFFYPILTRIMDSFFRSPSNTTFLYFKKGFQKFLNMLKGDLT